MASPGPTVLLLVLGAVLVAAACLFNVARADTPPLAVTTCGVIEGAEELSPDGLQHFVFRGIPYARAPVGDLRWKLPQPMPPFQSIYAATEFRQACFILG